MAAPHEVALAIVTAHLAGEQAAVAELYGEATADRDTAAGVINALVQLLRIELSWHAREVNCSSIELVSSIAQVMAELPYDDEQPPDDWEGWGPDLPS